jgi:hypothetical protein
MYSHKNCNYKYANKCTIKKCNNRTLLYKTNNKLSINKSFIPPIMQINNKLLICLINKNMKILNEYMYLILIMMITILMT